MIKEEILKKLPELSAGQLEIANYLLQNLNEVAFFTASELASKVGVSESTVVRFANALKFKGYPELREAIQNHLVEQLTPREEHSIYMNTLGEDHLALKIIRDDVNSLISTIENFDPQIFDTIVDELIASDAVYITGGRGTFAIAYFLNFYLSWFLPTVNLLQPDMALERLSKAISMKERPLLVGISAGRYYKGTVNIMEQASNMGIKTIGITNSLTSPIALASDLTLIVPSRIVSFVPSFTADLSMVNAIIITIAKKLQEKGDQTLATLEEIWEQENVYVGWKKKQRTEFEL